MIEHKQNFRITQAGFSLVEIMVSLVVFSIVMLICMGTLMVLIDANAKAQALSSNMTNLTFALDSMTRNIRTGKNYYCTAAGSLSTAPLPTNTNNCTAGGTAIIFTPGSATTPIRVAYRFQSNRIEQRVDYNGVAGVWLPITTNQPPFAVNVGTLRFIVDGAAGATAGDYTQPYVTFLVTGTVVNGLNHATPFSVQSQITQRVLNY